LQSGIARAEQTVSGVDALGELSRPELLGYAHRAAICVAPTLYEPFGLSVLEAAASGCALVLSDIPAFRELWDGAALFIDPRDAGAIRAALSRLIADDALRGEIQRHAFARSGRYSLQRMVEGYQALYSGVLERPSDTVIPFPVASFEASA
jgi:glycosyltransferase involved in cell wall biosynthesis